jgi:starch phosphorylase
MDACHAAALYDTLEQKVVPCFYRDRNRFTEIMRYTIAINGSFFNTHRMVAQYMNDAYAVLESYYDRVMTL